MKMELTELQRITGFTRKELFDNIFYTIHLLVRGQPNYQEMKK